MRLEGIHHVTAITGDAPANVDFYADKLGLRLVKKTVNQDDPTVYHLFYADEKGSSGSDITFFEYPGAARGRAGAGMVHRVLWRVGSEESLDFWAERLGVERSGDTLRFADPEGLEHELVVDSSGEEPLTAEHPEIPPEHGCAASPACARTRATFREATSSSVALGFEPGWVARGEHRSGTYEYDPRAEGAGVPRRGDSASRRLGLDAGRARGVAGAGAGGRRSPDAGDRALLLQVDLLPRAERRAVRDRDARPGLHGGRAGRVARRAALAAAGVRGAPRADRAEADPDPEPARGVAEDLTALVREAAGEPEGALVLFHGRGADEHDLVPLLDVLDPERRFVGITPRGPLSLPPGGAHWYAVREIGYPDPSTFLPTYELVGEWLDGLAFRRSA